MSSFAINTLTLDGNLVSDPELRTLPSGTSVCNLRIAHNEQRKDASGEYVDHAGFYDVTVWAGPGEWVAANLVKRDRIVVSGRLTYREYEDAQGKKRSQVSITAESVIPVKRNATAVEEPPAEKPPAPARATRARAKK